MVKLRKQGVTGECKLYTGAAAGDLVKADAKVAAVTDEWEGIIVDEIPTDNPLRILGIHEEGAEIDMEGASGWSGPHAVGTTMYSDGDGTISNVQPAGTCWIVGEIIGDEDAGTSNILRLRKQKVLATV